MCVCAVSCDPLFLVSCPCPSSTPLSLSLGSTLDFSFYFFSYWYVHICAFSSKTSTTHPHTPHFFALEKAEAQVVQHHGKRGFTSLVKGWCCSISSVQPASCSSILSASARSAVVRHLRLSAWSPFV